MHREERRDGDGGPSAARGAFEPAPHEHGVRGVEQEVREVEKPRCESGERGLGDEGQPRERDPQASLSLRERARDVALHDDGI